MELKQIAVFLLRRWWMIAIPVVIVALMTIPDLMGNEQAGSGGYSASFRYSAAQEQSNLPTRDGDYQDVWLASEFVVNAFTDWVRSSTFRAELAMRIDSDIDLSALHIASDNNRSIGLVTLSFPDARALEQIANAAIEVLQTRNHIYFPHLGQTPAPVTIIDAPVIVALASPLTNRVAPIIKLGVALFAGLVFALFAEYLDPTLHNCEEVEAQGIHVLATIPKQ